MTRAARCFLTAALTAPAFGAAPVLAQDPGALPPDESVYEEIPEPDAVRPGDLEAGMSADEILAATPDVAAPGALAAPAADPFATADAPFEEEEFRSTIQGDRVVLRGLNKVTAQTEDFNVAFNAPLQFGSLTVLARYCSRRPPELIPETFVFVEIFDRTFDGAETTEYGQKIFSGWMLGSSPALHGLEHPVYDIWPVSCHTPGDDVVAAQAAADAAAAEAAAEQDDQAAEAEVFVD